MKQEVMGWHGISWTICKSFAPRSRQTTITQCFTGWMFFLTHNQQCQSTEDNIKQQRQREAYNNGA